jgi:hypothetical protein
MKFYFFFSDDRADKLVCLPPRSFLFRLARKHNRGQSHKTFFGVHLLTLQCRLDLFIPMQQILLMFIKWSSSQKCG